MTSHPAIQEVIGLANDLGMKPERLMEIMTSVLEQYPNVTSKQKSELIINRLKLEGVVR